MEMFIRAFVRSIRSAKETDKYYVDFVFMGGSSSLLVDSKHILELKPFEGKEGDFRFLLRPEIVLIYSRPTCVFLPYASNGVFSSKRS